MESVSKSRSAERLLNSFISGGSDSFWNMLWLSRTTGTDRCCWGMKLVLHTVAEHGSLRTWLWVHGELVGWMFWAATPNSSFGGIWLFGSQTPCPAQLICHSHFHASHKEANTFFSSILSWHRRWALRLSLHNWWEAWWIAGESIAPPFSWCTWFWFLDTYPLCNNLFEKVAD